jgi:hypothetical protein
MYEEVEEKKKFKILPRMQASTGSMQARKQETTKNQKNQGGGQERREQETTKRPKTSACPSIRSNHSKREIFSFSPSSEPPLE